MEKFPWGQSPPRNFHIGYTKFYPLKKAVVNIEFATALPIYMPEYYFPKQQIYLAFVNVSSAILAVTWAWFFKSIASVFKLERVDSSCSNAC